MTTEYGIFNDEGLIEAGFYDRSAADYAVERRYDQADKVYVAEVCEHENEADHCDLCAQGDDDPEDEFPEVPDADDDA